MALYYVQTTLQQKLQGVSHFGTRWLAGFSMSRLSLLKAAGFGLVSLVVPALAVLLWF
jgi:hypothetical protein